MALLLLPVLNVGGMQLLRASDFNTLGKIMPRTKQIAMSIGSVYFGLTVVCAMAYEASGMNGFDDTVHAMTTLSTGGMGNSDTSFAGFSPAAQYVSTVFMLLGSLSFARYVQLARGNGVALWRDSQIRAFLGVYLAFVFGMLVSRLIGSAELDEPILREVAFNVASMLSSTGYASSDFILWGSPSVMLFFIIMLIGGCSGSTAGGVKIFRYELLFSAVRAELRRLYRPNIVILARYQGRMVSPPVMDSVIAFFMLYFLTFGIVTIILVLLGLDPMSAISGAASCLGNVGPGLSPEIGPASTYVNVPDAAKWVMSAAMMVGRLEIMVVFVLFSTAFWRG
jgi:trk system potassium uptake protein TrkH